MDDTRQPPDGTAQHAARSTQHVPVVRRATESDAPALGDVVARAFPDKFRPAFGTDERAARALGPYIASTMRRPGTEVYVAEVDGQIAGTVSLVLRKGFILGVGGMFVRAVGLPWALRAMFVLGFLGEPSPAADEAYVEVLGVAPEQQRRGIGRALMATAETRARALGRRRLTLYVTANNTAAQALYTAQGLAVQSRSTHPVAWLLFRAPGFWRMEKRIA